jgi:CheY-like chemotaxis protein
MTKTVVLIDDDQDDLDIMKEAIREFDESISLVSFQNPVEALRVITKELILLPDFIFIDINMPMVTGDKILRELRSIRKFDNVAIAILSTSMSASDAEKYRSRGANFTFQKPNAYQSYHEILTSIFF